MINKQANILFIPTSIGGYSAEPQVALSQRGYYRQLICASLARSTNTSDGIQVLGRQLAAVARHAYLARQMDAVEQATQVMLALPLSSQLESIARYHQALLSWRQDEADNIRQFERAVEEAPPQYKARALQAIGLTHHKRGELDAALPFYLAAGKAAANCDLLTLAESQEMIAVVRSIHGDHKQALADLERLFPLVRAIGKYYPAAYYTFLNDLAVELGEVGRIAEAEAACAIALASPFASAYPEWSETRDEIAAKHISATQSVVAINRALEVDPSPQVRPQRQSQPSRALAFEWPATKKDSFQTSVMPNAGATLNRVGNTLIILYCLRKCVSSRGPPALSQGYSRPLSESIIESAEKEASAAQNQFAIRFFCAQPYRFIVAISIRVSLCCCNYIPRSPPLGRNDESEARLLNRHGATPNVHSFKASNHQHLQPGVVHRREVNPHRQLGGFQTIWTGRRCLWRAAHLTAHLRVEGTLIEPTHVRVQEELYDYFKGEDSQSGQ